MLLLTLLLKYSGCLSCVGHGVPNDSGMLLLLCLSCSGGVCDLVLVEVVFLLRYV